MAKTVGDGFSTFLKSLVPTEGQRKAGGSHRASVKAALEGKLIVRDFFETGSFTHGTGVQGFSDIDVFASLGQAKPRSADTALDWVKVALSARFPATEVVIRRPAVVVKFAGGYETWEIIPAFLTAKGKADQRIYAIPGPNAEIDWIDSAPKEHLAYVNACNEAPHKGDAKALARLIKAWKYYCNVPISSFYLEMRCAQHVASQSAYIHVWDVCQLLERLQDHQLAAMNDPQGVAGRFYACSSEAKRIEALSKLKTAATRARKALDAYNTNDSDTSFYYLSLLFGGHFPSR